MVTNQAAQDDGRQLAALAQVGGCAPRAAKSSAQFNGVNEVSRQRWCARGGFGRLMHFIVFHVPTLADMGRESYGV
jgi:hypothetical protein